MEFSTIGKTVLVKTAECFKPIRIYNKVEMNSIITDVFVGYGLNHLN